jgi:hypothetical protein
MSGKPQMRGLRILAVKMGGGYVRALLLNGQETVFGRDERELLGRLKVRTKELRMHPDWALDIRR